MQTFKLILCIIIGGILGVLLGMLFSPPIRIVHEEKKEKIEKINCDSLNKDDYDYNDINSFIQ
jgi:hypothetical protein